MTGCPDDNTLGALVERSLDAAEQERVGAHLDDCATCREIVVAAVRGTARSTEPPRSIGRYELRGLVGAGGMGRVYEAYDAELDRCVALKVLRPELAHHSERLVRESRAMAKIGHPSVITVYDAGREGEVVFVAMELIRGETLGKHAAGKPWRDIVALYERAGAGLAAAHRAGIVHRDFKPDNVLVEGDRVVVTDFGIARLLADGESAGRGAATSVELTATGAAIGTPAYMAPEQLDGAQVDARADVFAFCVALWEALFGARPFPGNTVDEIRAAMKRPPSAPGPIAKILARGLAIDPAQRPELDTLVARLARVRSRRRRIALAVGAGGLVVVGIAVARLISPGGDAEAIDPCLAGLERFDRVIDARPLPTDSLAVAHLADLGPRWRMVHSTTCKSDGSPPQLPTVTACLDARLAELAAARADLRTDGGTHAAAIVRTVGEPLHCEHPAPSLAIANVPADEALRRKVTDLRIRLYELEDNDPQNIAVAKALETEARPLWPRVHAETLYVLGTAYSQSGDPKQATATFREAAAIAQTAHHDLVAANAWLELTATATFDDGDPTRGLEYLTYADAAIERLGRLPALQALFLQAKGTTLLEADRMADAEAVLGQLLELAESKVPDALPEALAVFAHLHEKQGNYQGAVTMSRRALDELAKRGQGESDQDVVVRGRLAENLAQIGKGDEAEVEARKTVEIAGRVFPADSPDRIVARETLAHVLHTNGKLDEALAVARATLREIAAAGGERSRRYAEALGIEGEILASMGRYTEATKSLARSCDILAFEAGEGSISVAQCRITEAHSLAKSGNKAAALAAVNKGLPLLEQALGAKHPMVANALVIRGLTLADLGRKPPAIADFERAIAILDGAAFDPGLRGQAELALGKLKPDRALLEAAAKHLAVAPASWKAQHDEAVALLKK